MRPIRLTMQAFGPFSGSQIIDFTVFGQNPMFLINGPTGSGKSTLLDAICYALYGSTAGVDREASQMRSDQSGIDHTTEVELEFDLGGKRWRVWRAPLQFRPKSRGTGFTEAKPEARLWEQRDDGTEKLLVSKSPVEATKAIENLTGLNADQFRQVMVLPQGKFRELLMAPSSEREKIFSTLFRTEIYKRIEDALKENAGDIRRRFDASREQMTGVLKTAGFEKTSELNTAIADLKKELTQLNEKRNIANSLMLKAIESRQSGRAVVAAFELLRTTETQLQTLKLKTNETEHLKVRLKKADAAMGLLPLKESVISQANQNQLLIKELSDLKIKLDESDNNYKDALNEHKAKEKALLSVKGKIEEQGRLKNYQTKLAEVKPKLKAAEELALAHQKIEKRLAVLELDQKNKINQIKQFDLEYTQHKEAVDKLPLVKEYLVQLEQNLRISKELDLLKEQQKKLYTKLTEAEKNTDKLQLAEKKSKKIVTELELQWHLTQASLLASQLQVGQPCPVCGSEDHPGPAVPESENVLVTMVEVDEARKLHAQKTNEAQAADKRKSELKFKMSQVESSTEKIHASVANSNGFETLAIQQEVRDTRKEEEVVKNKKQQLEKIELSLKKLRYEVESSDAEHRQVSLEVETAKHNSIVAQTEIKQLLSEIPESLRKEEHVATEIKRIQSEIDKLEQGLAGAVHNLKVANDEKTALTATLAGLQKQLADLVNRGNELTKQWETDLAKSIFTDEQDYNRSQLKPEEYEKQKNEVREYDRKLNELQGAVAHQKSSLSSMVLPDLGKLDAKVDTTTESYKAINLQWEELAGSLVVLESAAKSLVDLGKSSEVLEKEYSIIGRLSEVANGQSTAKVSLQRFVLGVLLDDVLIDASRRFQAMTKNRYKLVRREEKSKGNKASGLELDVLDAHTGRGRSVATLSGGESFMAALSLALGLSEVVQAYAGGVHLDTLFIDEGFGSLDQEALDLAIDALIELRASGRMIGVISHVAEMKQRITTRLDIVPTNSGSEIRIVNNFL